MTRVPPDFPRPAPTGAVPGAQPKLLAVSAGDVFIGCGGQDVEARYRVCEDLAQQLLGYSLRKLAERPDWTQEQVQEMVVASTRLKAFAWGLSPAETEWVVRRFESLAPA